MKGGNCSMRYRRRRSRIRRRCGSSRRRRRRGYGPLRIGWRM